MWLPKSSAPKDGSYFLAIQEGSGMVFAPYEIVSWETDQFSAKFTDGEIDFDIW